MNWILIEADFAIRSGSVLLPTVKARKQGAEPGPHCTGSINTWESVISRAVKVEYLGYTIGVTAHHRNGQWGTVILIDPVADDSNKLHTTVAIWGFDSEAEADERGFKYGKEKIDLYGIGGSPAREPKIVSFLSYKGSSIELSSSERIPVEWTATFEIPPSMLNPKGVGRMKRGGFGTRDDALKWARAEFDSYHIRR